MNLQSEKSCFAPVVQPAKADACRPLTSSSSASWPAPVKKAQGLVLKKTYSSDSAILSDAAFPRLTTVTPFSPPLQTSAFDVPRPVSFQPTASPWASPTSKAEALVARRSSPLRAEAEFSRPSFRVVSTFVSPVRQVCRSC